jgi:PrgI family protein
MKARIPQDVDLEDRLAFGLTPARFGYLVIAALGAFTIWSAPWANPPIRVAASLPLLGLGAALAWGRWRGRNLDRWAVDIAIYLRRNNLRLELPWHPRAHRQAAPPDQR